MIPVLRILNLIKKSLPMGIDYNSKNRNICNVVVVVFHNCKYMFRVESGVSEEIPLSY